MIRTTIRPSLCVAFFAGLTAVAGLTGCGKEDKEPRHQSIEGRVTTVDPATGEVRMLWYSPKQKREKEISGTLAPEAEILINGKTARLEDVQTDDKVLVVGRIEKKDGEPKLVAVRVDIRRPMEGDSAETKPEAAATQPQ